MAHEIINTYPGTTRDERCKRLLHVLQTLQAITMPIANEHTTGNSVNDIWKTAENLVIAISNNIQ